MNNSGKFPFKSIDIREFLTMDAPDEIRIKGHRIGPEHIIEQFQLGESPNQIAQTFPGVDIRIIYAVIAHYLWYQQEVDDYIANLKKETSLAYEEWKKNRTPISRKVEALIRERRQPYPLTQEEQGDENPVLI
ncbi:MAG: DUF433 domain-containing protein [Caldilineaceae bacterium]